LSIPVAFVCRSFFIIVTDATKAKTATHVINNFFTILQEEKGSILLIRIKETFLKIEIAIEGPDEAIRKLVQEVKSLTRTPESHLKAGKNAEEKSTIIFLENEEEVDETLLRLSRIALGLERSLSLENKFEFRTRNLAYSEPDGSSERFRKPFNPIPSIRIQTWRPSFRPIPDEETVIIDSRHAFGVGTHPTTRLCLECLEEMAKSHGWGLDGHEVLDFGCGTGLLAIAAVKMGAERALGIDIVQETARTARRNVDLNKLSQKITIKWGGLDQTNQTYDLIFANLVASALLRSGGQVPRYLKKDGRVVISGFSLNQMEEMEAFFKVSGLKTIQRSNRDGWGLLLMGHGSRIQEPLKTNRTRHRDGG
jgi:ribosomal protein L11 methyltransferase